MMIILIMMIVITTTTIIIIMIIIIIIYCTQCLEPRLIIFVHRVQYIILTKTFDLSQSALSLALTTLTTLTSHHRPLVGKRRRRKNARLSALNGRETGGHRQSDEHWNCFKSEVGEASKRLGGAHISVSERVDTILN